MDPAPPVATQLCESSSDDGGLRVIGGDSKRKCLNALGSSRQHAPCPAPIATVCAAGCAATACKAAAAIRLDLYESKCRRWGRSCKGNSVIRPRARLLLLASGVRATAAPARMNSPFDWGKWLHVLAHNARVACVKVLPRVVMLGVCHAFPWRMRVVRFFAWPSSPLERLSLNTHTSRRFVVVLER